jgi:acetyl-CoA carboxylase biotin carboxylase subunit
MNTRLQVEHPVTELLTGVDLVRAQLHVAAGEGLPAGPSAELRGHALEVRINAEDPSRDFLPAPGTVTRFRPPLGPGVRVDTFVEEGAVIPPFYDSLIAKVIVRDASRKLAIDRAIRVLGEFEVEGVPTTIAVLRDILASAEFRSGEYSTSFLEEAGERLPSLSGVA